MVDRWDIGEFGTPMDLMSDGDYVSYSDYAKLEQENQRLRDAIEEARRIYLQYADIEMPCGSMAEMFITLTGALDDGKN